MPSRVLTSCFGLGRASTPAVDFGYLTLAAGFEHGILHCIRFSVANQAWIIYETDTGRSGMVACLLLLPIVLPMKFDFFKKKASVPQSEDIESFASRRFQVFSLQEECTMLPAFESL